MRIGAEMIGNEAEAKRIGTFGLFLRFSAQNEATGAVSDPRRTQSSQPGRKLNHPAGKLNQPAGKLNQPASKPSENGQKQLLCSLFCAFVQPPTPRKPVPSSRSRALFATNPAPDSPGTCGYFGGGAAKKRQAVREIITNLYSPDDQLECSDEHRLTHEYKRKEMAEMSDEYFTGPQAFARARQHLQDGFEDADRLIDARAATLDRTLLTLSGGALTLSITLVCRPDWPKGYHCILFSSWIALTISLISVVIALRQSESDANAILREMDKRLKELDGKKQEIIEGKSTVDTTTSVIDYRPVRILNLFSLWGFVAGVILLGIYAGLNLTTAK